MECKNCQNQLNDTAQFCNNCGAKVIENRITFKQLFLDFSTNVLGWDNRYFITLKTMIIAPQVILYEYLNGVRKKYVNPFAYFAIGAALSTFVYNFHAEQYVAIAKSDNNPFTSINEKLIPGFNKLPEEKRTKIINDQIKNQENSLRFVVKYINIIAFISLPLYAFLSFLTYRKPYNYGEHLIMNSYIQGTTSIVSNILFLIAIYFNPNIFAYILVFVLLFYAYVFGKIYQLSIWKSIWKTIKFILILIPTFIITIIISGIIGFLFKVAGF